MPEPSEPAPATSPEEGDRTGMLLAAQATLSAEVRTFHVRILRAFLAYGTSPGPAQLAAWASELGLAVPEAMSLLAAKDLVHTHPDSDVVVVAYPFSGKPTDHVVELPDAPPTHAMCAIDALGVPLMSGQDGRIVSRDPVTGERIRVQLHGTSWRWEPETTVVLSAEYDEDGPSARRICPLVTFHSGTESAVEFLRRSGATGRVLDQPQAIQAAGRIFLGLLDADAPRPDGGRVSPADGSPGFAAGHGPARS